MDEDENDIITSFNRANKRQLVDKRGAGTGRVGDIGTVGSYLASMSPSLLNTRYNKPRDYLSKYFTHFKQKQSVVLSHSRCQEVLVGSSNKGSTTSLNSSTTLQISIHTRIY